MLPAMRNSYCIPLLFTFVFLLMSSCNQAPQWVPAVYETSEGGNRLSPVSLNAETVPEVEITLRPEETFQTISGFGGSFTESTAYVLSQLSQPKRQQVIEAYFGDSGARYSLTRTHINSCDFSRSNYSYAPIAGDTLLQNFSLKEDQDDIIPLIKDAMAVSKEGFKLIASPWTSPPWMKDNNDWRGGKLLPQYYDTWALFFAKYHEAMKAEGIDIWGYTIENEPLGNNNNWESMLFSPEEMTSFVNQHLGPKLRQAGIAAKLLGYDQNRDEQLNKWVDVMFADTSAQNYFDGTAVHWYASTVEYFPEALQYTHQKAPNKHIINSEACIDAQVPRWQDDRWYWAKEATDWGWTWAPDDQKYLHPKYSPVARYANDIIGCLNNWVDGWVDWNMVLDRQGGPNWAKNWCTAPVVVDPAADEVYYTPLFYTLSHFSRFIRPGAVRIGWQCADAQLAVTAARNPDGSLVVVVFNPTESARNLQFSLGEHKAACTISPKAIQTLVFPAH